MAQDPHAMRRPVQDGRHPFIRAFFYFTIMKTTAITITAALMSLALHAGAKPVPAELPDPDGNPGDATKPVKVYIPYV